MYSVDCGLADLRTCGLTDSQTYGFADLWTCGLTDSRTYGFADLQTRGLTDSRTYGLADLQTRGLMDSRTYGLADLQTCGLMDSRTYGLVDLYWRYLQLEYFVLCRHTAHVSPRVHESAEYIRPNWWVSLYLELHRMSLCPSLDLHTVC